MDPKDLIKAATDIIRGASMDLEMTYEQICGEIDRLVSKEPLGLAIYHAKLQGNGPHIAPYIQATTKLELVWVFQWATVNHPTPTTLCRAQVVAMPTRWHGPRIDLSEFNHFTTYRTIIAEWLQDLTSLVNSPPLKWKVGGGRYADQIIVERIS